MQTRSSDENSVCRSVRPSVKRVDCEKTEERSVQINTPYERSFSIVFWEVEWLVGGDPFYLKLFYFIKTASTFPLAVLLFYWHKCRHELLTKNRVDTAELTHPVTTTTKSIMFQTLRKYDPLCKTKPRATILNSASTQNIPKKYTSVSSCNHKTTWVMLTKTASQRQD